MRLGLWYCAWEMVLCVWDYGIAGGDGVMRFGRGLCAGGMSLCVLGRGYARVNRKHYAFWIDVMRGGDNFMRL
uniref:hypothetical protein n=1 Tax=Sporosarcina sp. USHLN248 TaxID=3081300 RepID=UPI00301A0405